MSGFIFGYCRPGRNYEALLGMARSVKPKEERRKLIEELVVECKRHGIARSI